MILKRLGIDLGTTNILLYIPEKGIVVNEPSVVAIEVSNNKIMAIGQEAKEMLGRTPDSIIAAHPLKNGVIANFGVTRSMLRYYINRLSGRIRIFKPDIMISIPAGATSTERRAVVDAAIQAGAKAAYVVKEPVLAAIGAGIPIFEPAGHMVADIGGGTADIAVISLGGIVASNSVKVAGNKLDQAIADAIKKRYNLAIGDRTAEGIKIKIGSAVPLEDDLSMAIKGRDLLTGLPRTVTISSHEITEALGDPLREIIQAIKQVLHGTPPELAADIMERGIVMSGGTSLLRNIDALVYQETGVPARIAEDPLLCVVKGTGIALEHLDVYKRSIMAKR